jgi:thiamine-monophosphate kinase
VLSDLAAMGATPQYGVLSLQVPRGFSIPTLRRFAEGIGERATLERFKIVGGDVTNGPAFGAVLTALGAAPPRPLLRTAKLGDVLCVSGPIGGAAADLRRLLDGEHFQPSRWLSPPSRLVMGQRLARLSSVHGAMDISEGLFLDARRMADAAGLGLELVGEAIPVDERVVLRPAGTSVSVWLARLGGGEDYELLVSVREGRVPQGLTPIGRFVPRGFHVLWSGKKFSWPRTGHLHG